MHGKEQERDRGGHGSERGGGGGGGGVEVSGAKPKQTKDPQKTVFDSSEKTNGAHKHKHTQNGEKGISSLLQEGKENHRS